MRANFGSLNESNKIMDDNKTEKNSARQSTVNDGMNNWIANLAMEKES